MFFVGPEDQQVGLKVLRFCHQKPYQAHRLTKLSTLLLAGLYWDFLSDVLQSFML